MRYALIAFLMFCLVAVLAPQIAFADDEDTSTADSTDTPSSPSTPDEASRRANNRVKNDIVFDSADTSAPVFSKSDETYRAPAAVSTPQSTK